MNVSRARYAWNDERRGTRVNIDSVGIIGGGAWGTALAQAMRHAGREVVLWAREAEVVGSINERHINETFLPGVTLDEGVRATEQAGRRRDVRCAAARRAGAARARRGQGAAAVACARRSPSSSAPRASSSRPGR